MKKFALIAAVMMATSVVALAGPPKGKKPAKKAAMVEVMTCPVMGSKVKDKGGKTMTVGNYRVHFCCAGCDTSFAKMSKADQLAKAKDAASKDKKG